MKIYITTIILLLSAICRSEAAYPLRETRAIWLTTLNGLDWPDTKATTEKNINKQKKELTDILDRLQKANINTVLFQTRVRATSVFPSTPETGNEPWDRCLTGTNGRTPNYDPLAFAIDECHRRGMELHAWIVTIPIGKWNDAGCRHLRSNIPNAVMRIGDEGYMNPANPQTAEYLARYCQSITRRYDVDGIHLDYIRYPETIKTVPNADAARKKITSIMEKIYNAVKQEKGWVKVSCSPIGKHDDTKRFSSRGWNARSRVYQDVKEWMSRGIVDIVFPMMYFRGNHFYPFLTDWQEGAAACTVVPGLGAYLLHQGEKDWPLTEMTRQLNVARQSGMGFCFFRSRFFTNNTKGIYDYVYSQFAPYPALPPALPQKQPAVLPTPEFLTVHEIGGHTIMKWNMQESSLATAGGIAFNIYASHSYPVDTSNPQNLIAMKRSTQYMLIPAEAQQCYYAVTAINRYGHESSACQQSIVPEQICTKRAWQHCRKAMHTDQ